VDGFDEKLQKILSNPEALAQVAKIAGGLSGGGKDSGDGGQEPPPPAAALPGLQTDGLQELLAGIDPKMLGGLADIAGELGRKDDRRTALLTALRPYVSAERQAKMDRAAQLVGLSRVIRRCFALLGGG